MLPVHIDGRHIILVLAAFMNSAQARQPTVSAEGLPAHYAAALKMHDAKRYAEAAAGLAPYFKAGPNGMDWHWNVAMYQYASDEALAGRGEQAMLALIASQSRGGSVPAEVLETDANLASLHGDPRFARLVGEARSRERLWKREPAQDVPYSQNLSEDAKLAGLSAIWAEARFNFAFFDRQPALDWNQAFVDFAPKVRATTSTEEYYRVLMKFAASLKDGHTNVYPPEVLQDAFYGAPALRTQFVEGAVLVAKIDDPALSAQGWQVGDQLLRIDGEELMQYANRDIAPYQSSSTPQDLEVRTYEYALLSGRAGSDIRLVVRTAAGREEERVLKRLSWEELSKFRSGPGAAFNLRPDGIAVLTIDEFEDSQGTEALLAHLPAVNTSRGLIIDVRANGGGSTPVDLLQLLTRQPIRGPRMRTLSYAAADRARGVMPGWTDAPAFEVPPDAGHHVGVPIAVLTSARTFSAAEDFVALFNAMHRGITVGGTTAGSTGQPLFFQLPGGGSARVCTRNDTSPDGVVFEGVGLKPAIAASPTRASVLQGRDVVLERAVLEFSASSR